MVLSSYRSTEVHRHQQVCSTTTKSRPFDGPVVRTVSNSDEPSPVTAPATTAATFRSQSIPIINTMSRTQSELRLRDEEQLADYRDYAMFTRIVDRIATQQANTRDYRLRRENDMCLAHIIWTRNDTTHDHHNSKNMNSPCMYPAYPASTMPILVMADSDEDSNMSHNNDHHLYIPSTAEPILQSQDNIPHYMRYAKLSTTTTTTETMDLIPIDDDDDEEIFIMDF